MVVVEVYMRLSHLESGLGDAPPRYLLRLRLLLCRLHLLRRRPLLLLLLLPGRAPPPLRAFCNGALEAALSVRQP
eukprot:105871-Prorocentrum_minimum.AAC.2